MAVSTYTQVTKSPDKVGELATVTLHDQRDLVWRALAAGDARALVTFADELGQPGQQPPVWAIDESASGFYPWEVLSALRFIAARLSADFAKQEGA